MAFHSMTAGICIISKSIVNSIANSFPPTVHFSFPEQVPFGSLDINNNSLKFNDDTNVNLAAV